MVHFSLCLAILAAPYTEYSRGLSEKWSENCELNRRGRDMAIEAGLQKIDANDLMMDLVGTQLIPPHRVYVEYWEEQEFDLCAFLKRIRALPGLPFFDRYKISQLNILLWMTPLGDPELDEWLIGFVRDEMRKPIKTEEEAKHMRDLLVVLGHERSDESLDILFRVQSKEAWVKDPPIKIQIGGMSPESEELERFYIRASALTGIAYSGTDRALHAFATGEGIADDMGTSFESQFRTAAHARVGIYGISKAYRIGLNPEVEAELRAIYKKHGIEYIGKRQVRKPNLVF